MTFLGVAGVLISTVVPSIITLLIAARAQKNLGLQTQHLALVCLVYGILILLGTTSSDVRRVLAYWTLILGLAIQTLIFRRAAPEALTDVEWWHENAVYGCILVIPMIVFHLIAALIFYPHMS